MVKSGQSIAFRFTTVDATGAAHDADALPTCVLVKNGVDTATTVTVTDEGDGDYKVSFTMPTAALNDYWQVRAVVVMGGVTSYGYVWEDSSYTADVPPPPGAGVVEVVDLRREIVERSGRYDLAVEKEEGGIMVPDFSSAGRVDYFINEALVYLCDNMPWLSAEMRHDITLADGDYEKTVSRLRELNRADLYTAGDGVTPENKGPMLLKDERWLRGQLDGELADEDHDEPAALVVKTPTTTDLPAASKTVWICPPADGDYTLHLWGYFYPPAFPEAIADNWIIQNHPYLLINCALWRIEAAHGDDRSAVRFENLLRTDQAEPQKDYYERLAREQEDEDGLLEMNG